MHDGCNLVQNPNQIPYFALQKELATEVVTPNILWSNKYLADWIEIMALIRQFFQSLPD